MAEPHPRTSCGIVKAREVNRAEIDMAAADAGKTSS